MQGIKILFARGWSKFKTLLLGFNHLSIDFIVTPLQLSCRGLETAVSLLTSPMKLVNTHSGK